MFMLPRERPGQAEAESDQGSELMWQRVTARRFVDSMPASRFRTASMSTPADPLAGKSRLRKGLSGKHFQRQALGRRPNFYHPAASRYSVTSRSSRSSSSRVVGTEKRANAAIPSPGR